MIPKNTKAILSEFRASRGQVEEHQKVIPQQEKKKRNNTPYDRFLRKCDDLENTIDDFNTQDLLFYFKRVAEENGYRYVISNIQKEMAIMKRLRNNYSNREICGMIEFLYESDQDYLEKDRLSPGLLSSGWVNTIYADMNLWVEDKYIPKSAKSNKSKYNSKGEWHEDNSVDEDIFID